MTRAVVLDQLRQLVAAGYSDADVAARLGVSSRTVLRWRAAAGIASQWRPEPAKHGTRSCAANGCQRPECLAAAARAVREYLRRKNAETPAARRYEPWTPADDELLLDDTRGTVLDRALLLQRSYGACLQRRRILTRRRRQ